MTMRFERLAVLVFTLLAARCYKAEMAGGFSGLKGGQGSALCEAYPHHPNATGELLSYMRNPDGLALVRFRELVAGLCVEKNPENEDLAKAIIREARAGMVAWQRKWAMSDRDMNDAIAFVQESNDENFIQVTDFVPSAPVPPSITLKKLRPDDLSVTAALLDVWNNGPTPLARLAFATNCLKAVETDLPEARKMAIWALCRNDVTAIRDRAQLDAELEAVHAAPMKRFAYRVLFTELSATAKTIDAEANKDPGLQKMVFEIPEVARQEWQKAVVSLKDVLGVVHKLEQANTSGSECAESILPAWKSLLSKVRYEAEAIKNNLTERRALETMSKEAIGSILGEALARGLVICNRDNRLTWPIAGLLGPSVNFAFAGERGIVAKALMQAAAKKQILFTDGNLQLTPQDVPQVALNPPDFAGKVHRAQEERVALSGIVETVSHVPQGVLVTFQKVVSKETVCLQSVKTNQITDVMPSGTVVYRYKCTKRAPVSSTTQRDPLLIPAGSEVGLKRGVFALFYQGSKNDVIADTYEGFPVAVWNDKAQQKLISSMGVAR